MRQKLVDLQSLRAERERLWNELLKTVGEGTEIKAKLAALYRLENRLLLALDKGGAR